MVRADLRAVITCVDPRQLNPAFVGRTYDLELLEQFPDDVDPCGENGEFHTFAWRIPGGTADVEIRVGEIVERDGFVFADLIAAQADTDATVSRLTPG